MLVFLTGDDNNALVLFTGDDNNVLVLVLVIGDENLYWCRVAKCHGFCGLVRLKIFADWGYNEFGRI